LRELGLTEQQWRVLRVLNESGPLEAGCLATDAVLLPPSVSRIVRDLVADGLLSRTSTRDDRRRVEVSITAEGLKLLRRGSRDSARAYRLIAKEFGATELANLLALLKRLEHRLDSVAGAQDGSGAEALMPDE